MNQETIFDVAVIGLGSMGSSTLYHLSQQNLKVLGIEQFNSPHNEGSHSGETRATRQAYCESPEYVPLVQESQKITKEIEKLTNQKLYVTFTFIFKNFNIYLLNVIYEQIGILSMGKQNSEILNGISQSVKKWNLEANYLNNQEINKLNPLFNIPENYYGWKESILQYINRKLANGGYLFADKCINAFLSLAQQKKNVKTYFMTKMISYTYDNDSQICRIVTDNGIFFAKKLILSCGIWASNMMNQLNIPTQIQKNQLVWFDLENENLKKEKFPIFMIKNDEFGIYGFPNHGTGFKVAFHGYGDIQHNVNNLDRSVDQIALEKLKNMICEFFKFKKEDLKVKNIVSCYYTNTPDGHFIIDFLPDNKNILILSPCSGHGFKFAASIGKLATKMIQNGEVQFPFFSFKRLLNKPKL